MGWLLRHNWLWSLIAFLLGAVITWLLLARRGQPPIPSHRDAEEPVLVGASARATRDRATPDRATPAREPSTRAASARASSAGAAAGTTDTPATTSPAPPPAEPDLRDEPAAADDPGAAVPGEAAPMFSRRMEAERADEPTLFDDADDTTAESEEPAAVPLGRYGAGSADAVPHQGPPDGFTIKGNAQSMLFHTPDSPYYGRTKPQVWFRTEADAERAGFTKYVRRPRKSPDPGD